MKFDGVNGLKLDNDSQNPRNMNEIYDMLEKYAMSDKQIQGGAPQGQIPGHPVIPKENIIFKNSQNRKG